METPKKNRITQKRERNKEIFDEYNKLRREEPLSRHLTLSYFYFKLSEKYFISEQSIARLIRQMEKDANTRKCHTTE